ncbi:MAG: hypothetical protein A2W85_04505 [Bacteroidetes bacterium GWF2_41_31]|nr:MAG: hypothetical protein A2W85_04505 [Bacteroidetes bacterium GWF2_41_31]
MKRTGIILLGLSLIAILMNHYFIKDTTLILDISLSNIVSFLTILFGITGLIMLVPYKKIPLIIFDPHEYYENKDIKGLVEKLRLRAILFNNISVIIFFFTLIIILIGFYLLVFPHVVTNDANFLPTSLTIRIGASVLLIFLVQILFRVFKYLLRVAAFYNAKADAIEFYKFKPDIELEKLMELFTPDKYEISDPPNSSALDNLTEMFRGKSSK